MRTEELQLLSLVKAYMCGSVPQNHMQGADEAVWVKLYDLAEKHKLTAVSFDRLCEMCDFKQQIPGSLYEMWKQRSRALAVRQTRFDAELAALLAMFHSQNVCYVLVKGALCRSLYRNGTLRISSDEDIIVSEEDFIHASTLLENSGFSTADDPTRDDVVHYRKQDGMYIELHRAPFPDNTALNAFFLAELKNRTLQDLSCGKGYSYTETVNFLMLVLHAKKHFTASGFGIRTLADIASFAMRKGKSIDWDKTEAILTEHRAMRFLQAMFSAAKANLGFSENNAACPPRFIGTKDESMLLQDILEAGIYGQSTMSRIHSAGMTYSAEKKGRQANVLSALFPKTPVIKRRYAYADRFPLLLPLAYMQRFVSYCIQICSRKHVQNAPGESIRIAKKRMRMMREYGMIE